MATGPAGTGSLTLNEQVKTFSDQPAHERRWLQRRVAFPPKERLHSVTVHRFPSDPAIPSAQWRVHDVAGVTGSRSDGAPGTSCINQHREKRSQVAPLSPPQTESK